jgi:hypothetical protein
MVIFVRTTLIIDDHVFKEAKRRALDSGMSLSELTTMALREALRDRDAPGRRGAFAMPTHGSGSRRTLSPDEVATLRDDGR